MILPTIHLYTIYNINTFIVFIHVFVNDTHLHHYTAYIVFSLTLYRHIE